MYKSLTDLYFCFCARFAQSGDPKVKAKNLQECKVCVLRFVHTKAKARAKSEISMKYRK